MTFWFLIFDPQPTPHTTHTHNPHHPTIITPHRHRANQSPTRPCQPIMDSTVLKEVSSARPLAEQWVLLGSLAPSNQSLTVLIDASFFSAAFGFSTVPTVWIRLMEVVAFWDLRPINCLDEADLCNCILRGRPIGRPSTVNIDIAEFYSSVFLDLARKNCHGRHISSRSVFGEGDRREAEQWLLY